MTTTTVKREWRVEAAAPDGGAWWVCSCGRVEIHVGKGEKPPEGHPEIPLGFRATIGRVDASHERWIVSPSGTHEHRWRATGREKITPFIAMVEWRCQACPAVQWRSVADGALLEERVVQASSDPPSSGDLPWGEDDACGTERHPHLWRPEDTQSTTFGPGRWWRCHCGARRYVIGGTAYAPPPVDADDPWGASDDDLWGALDAATRRIEALEAVLLDAEVFSSSEMVDRLRATESAWRAEREKLGQR